MRNLSVLVRLFGCLVLGALSACGSKPTVGILLPESGSAQSYGESMRKAIDLGLEQARANKTAPVGLEVVYADSVSDPTQAAAGLNLLADQGAQIVIAGVTSDEAKALLPVLEQRRVIVLSPSASAPILTKESRSFYRLFASDELEGSRAGRFLLEDSGDTTTVIYTSTSEHARGIEPPFRHVFESVLGGKVVGKVYYTDADWEAQSTDLLAAYNPASVYIIGYAKETMTVLKHLRDKGFAGTICAASSFNSGQVIEHNPELFENVYFPQPAFDVTEERPVAQQFVKAYRAKYDQDPDIYAAHAFDAVTVVMKVFAEAPRLEHQELRKTMQFSIKELPGVTGIIQFDDFGDVHHNPVMFIIKSGKVLNYQKYVEEQRKLIQRRIRDLLTNR